MSNHVYIERLKFTNLTTGAESVGYTVCDDFDSFFKLEVCPPEELKPLQKMPEDDAEMLALILQCSSDKSRDLFDEDCLMISGIDIDGIGYNREESAELIRSARKIIER